MHSCATEKSFLLSSGHGSNDHDRGYNLRTHHDLPSCPGHLPGDLGAYERYRSTDTGQGYSDPLGDLCSGLYPDTGAASPPLWREDIGSHAAAAGLTDRPRAAILHQLCCDGRAA